MTNRRHLVLVMTLAATMGVTGCAGQVKVTSAKMCKAHGGTYNASSKSCTYAAVTRTAKQTCEEQDGYFDEAAQICTFNP
jgi:hypothetical protein